MFIYFRLFDIIFYVNLLLIILDRLDVQNVDISYDL